MRLRSKIKIRKEWVIDLLMFHHFGRRTRVAGDHYIEKTIRHLGLDGFK